MTSPEPVGTLARMKEFAAFILLILLVLVGWNQPYKAHFGSVIGKPSTPGGAVAVISEKPGPPAMVAPAVPRATPAADRSWLWKKSTLDLPEGRTAGEKHGR